MVRKYSQLCMDVRRALERAGDLDAAQTARRLTAFAAGKSMEQLLRDYDLYAAESSVSRLEQYLRDYLAEKPLAYIFGETSFFGLHMKVTEDVLIPRDDTMVVAALAMEQLKGRDRPRVLDLCTGSGCIGIAIAHRFPGARVTLADISEPALRIARENAVRNGVGSRVNIIKADCLQSAPSFLGRFDIIVSNPPYITEAEMQTLEPSVRNYEPHLALCGGGDGLDFYRAICKNFAYCLTEDGLLCFEFGRGQHTAVGEILRQNAFEEQLYCRDASNIIRAVCARKNGKES